MALSIELAFVFAIYSLYSLVQFAMCGIVVFHCQGETALMSFFQVLYLKPFSEKKHFNNNIPLNGNVLTNSARLTKPPSVHARVSQFSVTKI